MKKMLYFFFACITTFISCTQEKIWITNTTITGKVTNKTTGVPIENCTVSLSKEFDYGVLFPSTHTYIKKSITGVGGLYKIKFFFENGGYKIRVSADNYFPQSQELTKKGNQTINFELIPKSVLKFKIKNISPYNKEDRIYLRIESSQYEGLSQEYECIGMNVDTTICVVVNGYYPVSFLGSYTKNKAETKFTNSVICASPGCEYIINY